LRQEEFAALKSGRTFPQIRPGDSVLVEKMPFITSTDTDIIKGVVIAKTNRDSDTAIRLLNVSRNLQPCMHDFT
jgi:ribosomal protein L19